jgi:hypothetical protein
MTSTEIRGRAGTYPVEISGWDAAEIFFVENAEVDWRGQSEKRVKLRRPLRKRSIIFVRHLHSCGMMRDCPTPYEVDFLHVDESGYCEYRLAPVRSRVSPGSTTVH